MSVPSDLTIENKGIGEWNIIHGYRGSIYLSNLKTIRMIRAINKKG